jgi:hypothetical protein
LFKSLNSHIIESSLSSAKKQLLWDNRLDYRDEDKPNIKINDEQQSRHKKLPRDIIKNHQTFRNFLRIYYFANEEFFESGKVSELQWSQLGKNVNSDKLIHEVQLLGHWSWCSGLFGEIIREAWINPGAIPVAGFAFPTATPAA